MAIYPDKNRTGEEPTALVPDMPGYQDFKHKPFGYMRTEQDQIWWLYWHFKNLGTSTDYEDLKSRVEALEADQQRQWEAIDDLRADIDGLRCLIYSLATSALVYDVTKGCYTASIAKARRDWQAQMYDGMTVADLATHTVEEAAALNVRHVAVDGRVYYMGLPTASSENDIPWQDSYCCADFNPDEFIRKSDLVLIDTDNLEQHVIMGVLTKDAASDFVEPTPYARPYTADDLADSYVLFNDHVVTDYPGRGVV